MVIEHRAVEERFNITDLTPDITARDVSIGLNRDEWQDLWRYQVPTGIAYIFTPKDTFSLHAEYISDAIDYALADDGGTITDETIEANEATANDLTLMPATEATNDAYYFGYRLPFGRARITYGTAGVGTAIAWEYWNGAAWVAIPGITDLTLGWTASAGTYNVSWGYLPAWTRTVVGGKEAYWVRARVSTASFTTVPVGDSVLINGGNFASLGTDRYRIEIRDSSEESRRRILGEVLYSQISDFTDVTKLATLNIGHEQMAAAGEWIVIQALPQAGILDVSSSFFTLGAQRIRESF